MRKTYWRSIQKSIYRSWLSLLVFFPKVTLSNYFPRKKDVRLPNGKNQIGNKLCSKTTSEKVTETHFQKVLKRQKSANSTIQKVLIRQKDAQTTLFLKFYSKSFSNLLGIEWHLLSLERTKIINASLYIGKYVFFISDWEWDKFLSHKKKRLRIRNIQNVASCCDLHNHSKNSFGCKGTIFNRG